MQMDSVLSAVGELETYAEQGSEAAKSALEAFDLLKLEATSDSALGNAIRKLISSVANPADVMYRQTGVAERSMAVSTASAILKMIDETRTTAKPETADLDGHG